MNNIQNESTILISIDKNNINNQSNNLKIIKTKHFPKPISSTNKFQTPSHISCSSLQNDENISNSKLNTNSSFSTKIILPKNISKLRSIENYKFNGELRKSFITIIKKPTQLRDKKQLKNENVDDNIEVDDIDEFNNIKFNINVYKHKLPFHNKIYYNNGYETEKKTQRISESIISNLWVKNPNDKPQNMKRNNYYKIYRNKSCSFENNNLIKFRLNQNISILNSKRDMLKTLIKARNKQILSFQLFFEKNNIHKKIKKNYLFSDQKTAELKKYIFNLKMKKLKCEEKYLNKKISEKEINNENFLYKIRKAELIEKILNYKKLLLNSKINIIENKNNELNINKNNEDESTIVNDSIFSDNDSKILEEKENINFNGNETIFNLYYCMFNSKYKIKNLIKDNGGEDLLKLNYKFNSNNNNANNCFLKETKIFSHKNNTNSKFNFIINYNKEI